MKFYDIVFVIRSKIGFHAAHAHKKRQARAGAKSGRTCGESNCHGRVFERNYIRGYHVYKEVWEAVGEALVCEKEPKNASDRYAVAVKKEGTIIGHLPRKVL